MTPNNLETVILILLFFLPGYVHYAIKSKFKYEPDDDKIEIRLLSFLFSSLIFQTMSAYTLSKVIGIKVMELLAKDGTLRSVLVDNFQTITWQVLLAIAIAIFFAFVFSLKQTDRALVWLQNKLKLAKYIDLSIRKIPPIIGAIEANTNFGQKAIGCVIELNDGRHFEGDIRHIGYGKNETDYIIVLSRIVTLSKNGQKKIFPPELKQLIPYKHIKTIFFKEYPTESSTPEPNKSKDGNTHFLPYLLLLPYLVILIFSQKLVPQGEYVKMIIELLGAFVVTFLGVYASYNYSKKLERELDTSAKHKIYTSSLELIASEMSLNEQTLSNLKEGLETMPKVPMQYFDSYGLFIAIAKDVQTKVFYGLISSGGMQEITNNDQIFNSVQQSYYNLLKTISGFHSSREVFAEYKLLNVMPPEVITQAHYIVEQETQKVARLLKMTTKAIEVIVKELKRYDITFNDESNSQ